MHIPVHQHKILLLFQPVFDPNYRIVFDPSMHHGIGAELVRQAGSGPLLYCRPVESVKKLSRGFRAKFVKPNPHGQIGIRSDLCNTWSIYPMWLDVNFL